MSDPFFSLKIVYGGTYPALKLDQIRYISFQILLGLKYMHSAGIVHRDIKPANVCVSLKHLDVKLIDFGLARSVYSNLSKFEGGNSMQDITSDATQYVQSKSYRAPELVFNLSNFQDYGYSIDIWSTGLVFLEMMSQAVTIDCRSTIQHIKILVAKFGKIPYFNTLSNDTHAYIREELGNDFFQSCANGQSRLKLELFTKFAEKYVSLFSLDRNENLHYFKQMEELMPNLQEVFLRNLQIHDSNSENNLEQELNQIFKTSNLAQLHEILDFFEVIQEMLTLDPVRTKAKDLIKLKFFKTNIDEDYDHENDDIHQYDENEFTGEDDFIQTRQPIEYYKNKLFEYYDTGSDEEEEDEDEEVIE